MIFVTLGSQKFQFNRLLKKIDELIKNKIITDEVFAQIGYSDYLPQNYTYKNFLDREEFSNIQAKCDIVITHAGTGAIMGALKKGKKVIAVPRLSKYGEHIDDHQIQIIEQFKSMNLICGLNDCSELEDGLKYIKNHKFDTYISNTSNIISSIIKYIENQT